jgi:predicted RNase H-like nuclease (RuvC/YqgF family)
MALERISNLGQLQEMQAEKLKKKLSSSTLLQQHANGSDDDLKLRTTTQLMIENNATQNLKDSPEKKYLQKEVERLQLQVSQMNSAVRQRDDELDKLKQTLDDERSIMAKNGISGSATQKIIELSHRNRDLHAELNKERSKSRQLQEKVSKLQQMIKDSEEENMKVADPSVEVKQKELISQLESQLCQVKQKAAEYSNNCQVIKQDLKIAHKILAREIGEKSVNISNLIANGGEGWKGRAQQILALQEKVCKL